MYRPFQHSVSRSCAPRRHPLFHAAVVMLLLCAAGADAQTHLWSKGFDSVSEDRGQSVAVDASGDVIVLGNYSSTIDFGGGPMASNGYLDVVLAKYDSDGNHIWSQHFGGTSNERGNGVCVDADGNIFVTGSFVGSVSFGGAPISGPGAVDIFLAKYDASGAHQWSIGLGDIGIDDGASVACDSSGNVLLTGHIGATDPDGSDQIYITKYSAAGAHMWTHIVGGTREDRGLDICADPAGNVIATGYHQDQTNFGGGTLFWNGGQNVFVVKYDPSGNHVWSFTQGLSGNDAGTGVCTDASGSIVLTGYYTFAANFGGGPLPSVGGREAFLAKFDPAGNHLWSLGFAGTSDQEGLDVDVDATGNPYITGFFLIGIDLGGGPLPWETTRDIFIAKFSYYGTHLWSQSFGSTGVAAGADEGHGIAVDNGGGIFTTGEYTSEIDFGGGFLGDGDGPNMYVVKFGDTPVAVGNRPVTATTLEPNTPNPFNPTTTIRYTLERAGYVTLAVYDVTGRKVATLVEGHRGAGPHTIEWDGTDARGRPLGSGVYLYRLHAGTTVLARKMVLLK